ncbi:MAG TPA: SRPBCC family protein [Solirubrobacterales bacterium]|nr:SRPBCC family protein [Solirubrobacterales bacterium]
MAMTDERKAKLTLPADDQILVTRELDAPPHLVYRAWTTPELVARWWTAKRGVAKSMEIDLRVGGSWRYVMETFEGQEVAFHGVYREIVPDERLVTTEVYEGAPLPPEQLEANATLNTVTFAERGGRTLVTMLTECPSHEVREMIVASGMEDGLQDALDLLEGVAQELQG